MIIPGTLIEKFTQWLEKNCKNMYNVDVVNGTSPFDVNFKLTFEKPEDEMMFKLKFGQL